MMYDMFSLNYINFYDKYCVKTLRQDMFIYIINFLIVFEIILPLFLSKIKGTFLNFCTFCTNLHYVILGK